MNQSKLIKQLRGDLTQEEFSKKVGLTQKDVSRYERERHSVPLLRFLEWCEIMDFELRVSPKERLKAIDEDIFLSVGKKEKKKDLDKKSFSHLSITKETPINHAGLSIRALNALGIISQKFEGTNGLKWDLSKCEVTVGHFEGLKKSDLYGIRNVGKKSINEIEEMFFEAGVELIG